MGHHDGNSNDMQAGQRRRHTVVVTHQATEARHPGEPALDHPAPRQHDNASCGGQQRDHRHATAVGGGLGCRLRTGVPLVTDGHRYRVTVSPGISYMYMRCASAATCARSWSLAGVTTTANRCPDVTHQHPHVMHHLRNHARFQPALGLVIHHGPGGTSVGSIRHGAPVRSMERSPLATSRRG